MLSSSGLAVLASLVPDVWRVAGTYFLDGIHDTLWCESLGILANDFPVFVYIIGIVFDTDVYSCVIEVVLKEERTVSLWEQKPAPQISVVAFFEHVLEIPYYDLVNRQGILAIPSLFIVLKV